MGRGLGVSQRRVLTWLQDHPSLQLTVGEVSRALEMSKDQVKTALARLLDRGLVLRTYVGRSDETRWSVDPSQTGSSPA